MILISILEVLAVVAVIIGFIHEDKVIAFEERISEKIRKRVCYELQHWIYGTRNK